MTKRCVGRPMRVVVLAGVLLLAANAEVWPWAGSDQSVAGRLAALVSCVLPATADDPWPAAASRPPTTAPDCEPSTQAWTTPC
jgi:hypothetical protein